MGRAIDVMRVVTIVALLIGVALFFGPTSTHVASLDLPELPVVSAAPPGARAYADSLAEDIILYNLFSSSRAAPSGRYRGPGVSGAQDADVSGGVTPAMGGAGFAPSLVGTAVSERPGATRALLVLDAADQTPRLYAVGEGAGGYRVVSIEARSVELAGPRGRVVLRLPQDMEDDS